MSIVKLVKWGNSIGIRIPREVAKAIQAKVGQQFEVIANSNGGFYLKPIRKLQQDRLEAFSAIGKKEKSINLIDVQSNFDREEWTW